MKPQEEARGKKYALLRQFFHWVEIVGHVWNMIESLAKVIPRRVCLHLTCSCSVTDQGCLWNLLNEGITGGCNLITTSQLWSKSSLVRGSEFCISVCRSACFVAHWTSLLLFGKELVWGTSFLFPPFPHFFLFFSIKNQTSSLTYSR